MLRVALLSMGLLVMAGTGRRGGASVGASRVAPLFRSDWSTATGTSDAALRDTGKGTPWQTVEDADAKLTVIATSARSFPTTNILQVKHQIGAQSHAQVYGTNIWPLPAVGQSLFFREYFRNEIADAEGDKSSFIGSCHPLESNIGGTTSWEFLVASKNDGTFPFQHHLAEGTATFWIPGPNPQVNLSKLTTYRFERQFLRTATDTYTLDMRIYSSADALLYDATTISWSHNATLTTLAAGGAGLTLTDANMRGFALGTNGGQWTFVADQFTFWGGVCVRSDDWCGAYNMTDG